MRGRVILAGLVMVLVAGIFWGISWLDTQGCLIVPTCLSADPAALDTLRLTMLVMAVVIAAGSVVVLVGVLLESPKRGFQPMYRAYPRSR